MWYSREKGDKLKIVSIPLMTAVFGLGGIILQIVVAAVLYEGILNGTILEIFGYGLFKKILSAFAFSIPVIAAIFFYTLIPMVSTTIDRKTKTVSVGKMLPFSNPRRIGFEFIKAHGCIADFEAENLGERGLYIELDSGEKLTLSADSSYTEEKTLAVAELIRKYLAV